MSVWWLVEWELAGELKYSDRTHPSATVSTTNVKWQNLPQASIFGSQQLTFWVMAWPAIFHPSHHHNMYESHVTFPQLEGVHFQDLHQHFNIHLPQLHPFLVWCIYSFIHFYVVLSLVFFFFCKTSFIGLYIAWDIINSLLTIPILFTPFYSFMMNLSFSMFIVWHSVVSNFKSIFGIVILI